MDKQQQANEEGVNPRLCLICSIIGSFELIPREKQYEAYGRLYRERRGTKISWTVDSWAQNIRVITCSNVKSSVQ
jgi:hypothetical protein